MRKFFHIYSRRINYLTIIIFIFSATILSSFFKIQVVDRNKIKKKVANQGYRKVEIYGKRGEIIDTKNNKLSESINKYDFWVNTNKPFNKEKILKLFSKNFNKPDSHYMKILSKKSNYAKLEKDILFLESNEILKEINDIDGLNYNKKSKRYYPYNTLACQTLGYVDLNEQGKGGIEENFNTILNGDTIQVELKKGAKGKYYKQSYNYEDKIKGNDIQLTIDVEIQKILQEELIKTVKNTKSKSANGVIINPFTGDIVAMASIPDFDPNKYYKYDIKHYKNRVISDSYEPGSTFKIIPVLASLKNNDTSLNNKYYCENGTFNLTNKNKLHDHEPHDTLSLKEIFIHSSNIGISKTVSELENINIYKLCKNLGFGTKTGLPFRNESTGKLRNLDNWSRTSKTYVSIGQEIGITNMQLALAYCAIANGGYLLKPNIIKRIYNNDEIVYKRVIKPIRQVASLEESKKLIKLLNEVVDFGTAKNLNLNGYKIGGKTGTAQKFVNGEYSKNEFISSFASIFPLNKPKYILVVSIDSPYYGKHWANESAVPLSKNIINRIIVNDNALYQKNKNVILVGNKKINTQENELFQTSIFPTKKTYDDEKVPNFKGKSLREALKISNSIGLKLEPSNLNGRVVWQSIKPGTKVINEQVCKIKLSI